MQDFATQLYTLMTEVTPNSHQGINHDKEITYPYMTYNFGSDGELDNQERMDIEVQVFDYGTSYARILELEEGLKRTFHKRRVMTDELFLNFRHRGSQQVPTATDNIKRRDTIISVKTDWRNK